MSDVISLEFDAGVASVILDRPPVNALDSGMVSGLDSALDKIDDSDASAILIRSAGSRVFCAGADIAMIEECLGSDEGRERMLQFIRRLQAVLVRIEQHPLPSVVALDAAVTGGGLELALACDLRVAGEHVRLGLPEARIGLLPGAGGTQRLTALAGPGVARRLILGAELISGSEAERLGVVQRSVPHGEVVASAREWARGLASLPRQAAAFSKRCISLARSQAGFDAEIEATAHLLKDQQTAKLVAGFLAGRRNRSASA